MGGGGGGGSRSVGNLPRLAEEAKKALSSERRNVFISFAYEDIDEVNLLRGQSKNELSEIAFNDWSVPEAFESENAEYIRRQISERISQSSVVCVYLSPATPPSRWVAWEVQRAIELGKTVIAVHAGQSPPLLQPPWISANKIQVIPWASLAATLKALK